MESKIRKLSHQVEDNIITQVADKQFQYFDLTLEKPVANDDFSVMNENLTNKDMVISNNCSKSTFKDYLEVLEVIRDDEVKSEEKNV